MPRPNVAIVVALAAVLVGCDRGEPARSIRLATTTSTENSGLLDVLLPAFRQKTGVEVQVLPMGTGKALRTARDGNCDVVLVHAPDAEQEFVREGWGVDRRPVMYNDFVLLGPGRDPAGVKGMQSAAAALARIHAAQSPFVSRGDQSGTHRKEITLWQAAGAAPRRGSWYRSVGKGMGQTLIMANEMQAYTLADRGTFLRFRKKVDLVILVAGDQALRNPYAVMAVNPARWPHVKYALARKLIEFLTSPAGQTLIGGYKADGEVLFHPWPRQGTGGQPTPASQEDGGSP